MKGKISLIALTSFLLLIGSPPSSAVAAGITKTATEVTYICPGGGTKACPGGATRTVDTGWGSPCRECGIGTARQIDEYCTTCNAHIHVEIWSRTGGGGGVNTGHYHSNGSLVASNSFPHGTISYNCSHGNSSSHTVYTGTYQNSAYGYSGASRTFIVYPVAITASQGLAGSYKVSGATATDAVLPGKTVTLSVTGMNNQAYRCTVNGVTTQYPASQSAVTFTMPGKDVSVILELAKQTQAVSLTTTYTKIYNSAKFNLNATLN